MPRPFRTRPKLPDLAPYQRSRNDPTKRWPTPGRRSDYFSWTDWTRLTDGFRTARHRRAAGTDRDHQPVFCTGISPSIWANSSIPASSSAPDSPIPNTGGIRNDVVDALKPLGDPGAALAGRLLRRHLPLARRHRAARESRPQRDQCPLGHGRGAERLRHARVHGVLPRARRRAVLRRATWAPARPARLRDWIEYCNFAGQVDPRRRAARKRRGRAVRHPLLGHRQRELGLRRQHDAGGVRRRVRPLPHVRLRLPGTPRRGASPAARTAADWNWTRRFFETLGRALGGIG